MKGFNPRVTCAESFGNNDPFVSESRIAVAEICAEHRAWKTQVLKPLDERLLDLGIDWENEEAERLKEQG